MYKLLKKALTVLMLFWGVMVVQAQIQPKVKAKADKTQIKIGEQIRYNIEVEVDSSTFVSFPEGQTFMPMEVVEATPIDSSRIQERLNLIRTYWLTQFDSGSYIVPPQKIVINQKPFYTDSLRIEITTVEVDTLKQALYDIKPMMEVTKTNSDWMKLLFLFIGIVVVALLVYWFFFRKKPMTEEEKMAQLPPFERAIIELKNLEQSRYLIQSQHKEYYSQLTNIVRAYLEEEVHISALESTTDELITKLEVLQETGNLKLEPGTISNFKSVLQKADLVKFAKSKPEISVAENDRKIIEEVVVKTKEALPEPDEEELLKTEVYKELLAKRKHRRKIAIVVGSILGAIVITFGATTAYYGFTYVKDTIIRNETKLLLEGDWIMSDYGYPPTHIETPKVLVREEDQISDVVKHDIHTHQLFSHGNIRDGFYLAVSVTTFSKDATFDIEKTVKSSMDRFTRLGSRNMIVKEEEVNTLSGKKGIKMFGTMVIENSKKQPRQVGYTVLSFVENSAFQQVIFVYDADDSYVDKIIERTLQSLDFKQE
ncbi:hypothetical protein [Imtechella halotolerans]|uniref:Uncharacterized protein n=2 Tax=Imtechella TaxID=1165076 RepID=I0WJQ1_9FLAO|nr:hypothetical protein [Imtechella halotolerans]EID76617.1 hypothetical protein W5A_01300 [Imtechella halotolerans K1]WMQ62814.1 hypothetical protein PT603_10785 [Imtechella halotolerans]